MDDYKTSSNLTEAANSQNIPENPEPEVVNTSPTFDQESTVLYERPRIYKTDFSSLDPTQGNFQYSEAVAAIPADFWNTRPDPVSGDMVVGKDKNGMPVQVFLTRRDSLFQSNLNPLQVPADASKRKSGYVMDAFVTTQLPPGTVNVRSPDESVYIDVEEDDEVEGKFWTNVRGLTINGLKADDQGTEISIVSEDSTIKVHTQGKRINLEAALPDFRSEDASVAFTNFTQAGYVNAKGLTLNGFAAKDVNITSPNSSISIQKVADNLEIEAAQVNNLGPVPVTIESPNDTILVTTNVAANTIELESEVVPSSTDETIAFNNPADPGDMTAMSLNGLKARSVKLAGEDGTQILTNPDTGIITIKGGGVPEGYSEHLINLCINGVPHSGYILMRGLMPLANSEPSSNYS